MVFHFKWKSREIRFDEEWNSVLFQKQLEELCLRSEFNFDLNRVAAPRIEIIMRVYYIMMIKSTRDGRQLRWQDWLKWLEEQ